MTSGTEPGVVQLDSYRSLKALAETVNGYYKAEIIYGPTHPGPWRTVDEVELATLGCVHWHNTQRLHGYLGDLPPAEYETAFYATKQTDQSRSESNSRSLHTIQGDSQRLNRAAQAICSL